MMRAEVMRAEVMQPRSREMHRTAVGSWLCDGRGCPDAREVAFR